MRAFFYDTWAFVALANTADRHHELAAEADRLLEARGYVAVTSDYIFDETLTALHATAGGRVALGFADLLLDRVNAGDVLLVDVAGERRDAALAIFRRLAPDVSRLSFTDCTSFVVMRELAMRIALTADRHFHQAGEGIRPLVEQRRGALHLVPPPA